MKKKDIFFPFMILAALSGLLVSCTPEMPAPQQIAAYPQSSGGDWYLPVSPEGGRLVYDAYLALDVRDPEAAAAEANRLSQDYGGYLVNSYTSYIQGDPTITLEIRIPPHNFEAARRSFRSLGTLVRETVSGDWKEADSGWEVYAQFTLFFRQRAYPLSLPETDSWHPGQTLQRALGISVRLLGFVVDLVIWVVVILGPFALLGWAAVWIYRRLQGPLPVEKPNLTEAPQEINPDSSSEK